MREETGLRCELGEPAGQSEYVDRSGRQKLVRYWRMRPLDGTFQPGREVDQLRWLPVPNALDQLSYENDRRLVRAQDL